MLTFTYLSLFAAAVSLAQESTSQSGDGFILPSMDAAEFTRSTKASTKSTAAAKTTRRASTTRHSSTFKTATITGSDTQSAKSTPPVSVLEVASSTFSFSSTDMPASEPVQSSKSRRRLSAVAIAGIFLGILIVIGIVGGLVLYHRWLIRQENMYKAKQQDPDCDELQQASEYRYSSVPESSLPEFVSSGSGKSKQGWAQKLRGIGIRR
ncbi:hypothetical protein BU26DRAFT_564239 [Trematosphaeria pertusa]|uniref:Mid2 domain-containing protein n=1 Tax=Trematosphaeria pertusa TaxID=390896 RepID=A0A6A6IIE7_9PLEO|nr:uncharacterized protein BU26DRAFT_564239 [Trematosphaeria pertusa]KAF2250385.1 hypothetical protein BU26DRAFT_564239 [Trematosphaeria pertusa]